MLTKVSNITIIDEEKNTFSVYASNPKNMKLGRRSGAFKKPFLEEKCT